MNVANENYCSLVFMCDASVSFMLHKLCGFRCDVANQSNIFKFYYTKYNELFMFMDKETLLMYF